MNRSSFLSSAALAAVTIPGGSEFVERRANFDAASFDRLAGKAADIRQVWEAVAFHPGVFNNVKNALNGLHFGFGYDAARIATIFAPHGPSSAYTYSDALWQKYRIGAALGLKDSTGASVASNIFVKPARTFGPNDLPDDPAGFYQDASIETLQARGVQFLTCHTAVEEQARAIVKNGFAPPGMDAAAVANDILTNLIPGTFVVPAMVGAIAVLQQRYHYSYITLTFA